MWQQENFSIVNQKSLNDRQIFIEYDFSINSCGYLKIVKNGKRDVLLLMFQIS